MTEKNVYNQTIKIYNHLEIEPKWNKKWIADKTYKSANPGEPGSELPKFYALDMFPYPSGAGLHVGHPRGYIASDVIARAHRMKGYNVLHPMGFDSFGLPAEQYAISTGNHPSPHTDKLITYYKSQLENLGFSFDWSREIATHKPEYYKFTQEIFLMLYEHYYDTKTNKAQPISTLVEILETKGSKHIYAAKTANTPEITPQAWNQYSQLQKEQYLMNFRIAYEGESEVNWCNELNTVLANDEIITDEKGNMVSERGNFPVIRKSMRQWFMRITAYADRLLEGLTGLDWPKSIKEIQKNWIGKSIGSEIPFEIVDDSNRTIEKLTVFTTRPDTLFGVTYIVIAPEHKFVTDNINNIQNSVEINNYFDDTTKIATDDRINESREKTGVLLKGLSAKHPLTGELLQVWTSNFVLANYGTGVVMAVPAHDERDYAFAKKYSLPIKQVIEPIDVNTGPLNDAVRPEEPTVERFNVVCIVEHATDDTFLCAQWKQVDWRGFVTGGIDEGSTLEQTALTELHEETGYKNAKVVKVFEQSTHGEFYHVVKKVNRLAHYRIIHIKLIDEERDQTNDEEQSIADFVWVPRDKVHSFLKRPDMKYAWEVFTDTVDCTPELGMLVNSAEWSGKQSSSIMDGITARAGGVRSTKFKMRDAIFARQRYWGEPIPLIKNPDGTIRELEKSQLPLILPEVDAFTPTPDGKPPLARNANWLTDGYETNTMPGWAGSSWYFLRYMDPTNTTEIADKEALRYWKNVDLYIGGAEHATGHLLYARFWNMFLFDTGIAVEQEPFQKFRNLGMILGEDSRKMSKRWGNVINPDDVVEQFGADTLRVYEMFIGPFESSQAWSLNGIVGSRRFIERIWKMQNKVGDTSTPELVKATHQCADKVMRDIDSMSFNTAISAMMSWLNTAEKSLRIGKTEYLSILRVLAPFAPYITEELFSRLDGNGSIHKQPFPKLDESLLANETVTIAVQVNGKVRHTMSAQRDVSEQDMVSIALTVAEVTKWTGGKSPNKVIFVPNKILNIIIKN